MRPAASTDTPQWRRLGADRLVERVMKGWRRTLTIATAAVVVTGAATFGVATWAGSADVTATVRLYQVHTGDTLASIADEFGSSASCVAVDNGHAADWQPIEGQIIFVFPGECPPTTTTSPATSTATTTPAATTTVPPNGGFAFPTSVSANGRYLLDQNGQPYLMQADTAWCLPNELTPAQADTFFANRAAEGFNTVLVAWACGPYIDGHSSDGASYDGLTPFIGGDWSKPTPAYWDRMDQYVASAKAHGIELAIDNETGSFVNQMVAAGPTVMRGFGQFLASRYAPSGNVMFVDGNDYGPSSQSDAAVFAWMDGINDVAPNVLQSVELYPTISTTYDNADAISRSDWATAYSYYPTYDVVLRAYQGTPAKPAIMFEANYEGENLGVPGGGGPATTAETIRRQIYWTMTSGGAGHFYGNLLTYTFDDPAWPTKMATPAVAQNQMATALFRSLPWQDLVPDADFLTDGKGTYDGSSTVDVLQSDYATAARTPDGAHAVVYLPTARTITIDASKLPAQVSARWFDPTTGTSTAASRAVHASRRAARGRQFRLGPPARRSLTLGASGDRSALTEQLE